MSVTEDACHPEAVDAPCKVIVETVHGTGPFIVLHDSAHLKVRERTADGHEHRRLLIQLQPVGLPESHDVIRTLPEIDVPDSHRVLDGSHVYNPCSGRGVAARSLALELVIATYLIANDLITPRHPVRKAKVEVLEVLRLLIHKPYDIWCERPDGFLGESPWKHVVHAVLQVLGDRLHLIAGRIKRFLLVAHLLQILAVGQVRVGIVRHTVQDASHLVPLVLSHIIEGTEILHDKGDDIPATPSVMTEVRLAGLVLGITDDDGVNMAA